jgi:SAM-dependent methyltransferase
MLKLNLGCSDDHRGGYLNVDCAKPADLIADLCLRWPWDDGTVDEIYAHDVFEHLYDRAAGKMGNLGKIWALNEAWRVLKPGGILDLAVPCSILSDGRMNPGAFADPTHVSFWTMDDRYYFFEEWNNPQGERGRLGPAYGIVAVFRPLVWKLHEYGNGPERRSKILATLEAVK